eukprot:1185430-Prorocentrum_minimum.AAC.2
MLPTTKGDMSESHRSERKKHPQSGAGRNRHHRNPQHDSSRRERQPCPTQQLKILALHGRLQCAELFEQRLKGLTKAAKTKGISFHFIDAPHELPRQDGQQASSFAMIMLFNRMHTV